MVHYKRLILSTAIGFFTFFYIFVLFYERYEYNNAISRIQQHGVVISNALWNLNREVSQDYLMLACKSHKYKSITVFDDNANIFQSASVQTSGLSEKLFIAIGLISDTPLSSDVIYQKQKIGRIEAIWKCDTIYLELYGLLAMILAYTVCHLNIRLLYSKNMLEQKVKLRTMELSIVNSSLQAEVQEHYQAREALDRSEEHYRILVENMPDILYRTDIKGTILFISSSCENVSGYKAEDIIGKRVTDLFYEEPDKRDAFIAALERNGYVNNYEEKLKRKDGSPWWVSSNSHFFRDPNGNIAGIEGVFRDVTSKKFLENELQQAKKMESIGRLAGGIAHDFNNILGIMLGNAELAIEDIPQSNPAYAKIEAIKTAGQKASDIVKQLLSFTRKTEMELKPINIIDIIRESIQLLRATIPSTIKIMERIPPDIQATILGHPTQIHQIIINLCINASQAMEENGGSIEIKVEKHFLHDRSEGYLYDFQDALSDLWTDDYGEHPQTEEHVKLTVTDTGHGIKPEIIDKIFDPYFTTKPVDKGTGMGLAVVHAIVKNHNGSIMVRSTPSYGTTFTILLPLVKQPPVEILTAISNTIYTGTEKILFVDDDELIVEMTNEMLGRLGYKVEIRTDPEEALELFRADPDAFDLIITDMTMPKMTGRRLAERVRQIPSDIPFIICSGYSSMIDEETAKDSGIAAYLMKPVSMKELGETVRNVLDSHKKRDG